MKPLLTAQKLLRAAAFVALLTICQATYADYSAEPTTASSDKDPFRLEQLLPDPVAQNTDINLWGWFAYLHNSDREDNSYWNGDVSFGITQRIGDRLAATADIHYIDDNNKSRGFLEQAFVTANLSEQSGTLLTVGKFNANFGVEARSEWDRLAGTTSLLFGAQPQDLVGVILTQPIGETGIKLRPFIATQFDGHADFDAPPSGGLLIEYQPTDTLRLAFTNWVGPGFIPPDDDDEGDAEDYSYASHDYAIGNWTGPNINGDRHGVMYFADANVQWNPRPDLTLDAEGLFASVGGAADREGWAGFLFLASYDITDRLRIFGRYSYLNDAQGLVSGVTQTHQELSAGAGFEIVHGLELRGEYRHDFANTGDLDSLSAHLTFSY